MKNRLNPREKMDYENAISKKIVDPNVPIRAFNDNENQVVEQYKSLSAMVSQRAEFNNGVPAVEIIHTYLGLALYYNNMDAIEILLRNGAKPLPSIECLIAAFPLDKEGVIAILRKYGRSENISPVDQVMLKKVFTHKMKNDPEEMTERIAMLQSYDYPKGLFE
jgi:hypothetical protein